MSKLDKLNITHGKTQTFAPTTLDQILGDTGIGRYGTMDVEDYRKELEIMNKADLQAHATKVGLVPVDDRNRMIKRLVNEFNLYVSAYRRPVIKKQTSLELSPEVARILAQGR